MTSFEPLPEERATPTGLTPGHVSLSVVAAGFLGLHGRSNSSFLPSEDTGADAALKN